VLLHLDGLLDSLDGPSEDAARVCAAAAVIRAELIELAGGYAPVACADLSAAIAAMIESFPVAVELDMGPVPVDEMCGRVLYFVAAEALSNVLKHSQANAVNVCLHAADGWVELRVEDDGTGDVSVRPGGGLAGLADRLSAAGGSLECRERAPRGTAVIARLPEPAG
jgi:signal transduction histidine kinase